MKIFILAAATAALVAGPAMAQPDRHDDANGARSDSQHAGWHQDRGGDHHWKRGERMGYNDWNNAQPVDYRQHHLRQPPRGYEWRESNGQYVLAAVATGLVAAIMLSR